MLDILLIEDNEVDVDLFYEHIDEYAREIQVSSVDRLVAAFEKLEAEYEFDVILLDLNLPDSNGLKTFEKLYSKFPDIPIIVLSGINDEELAITTISKGAQDYLMKNYLNGYVLYKSIQHSIERHRNQRLLQRNETLLSQTQKMDAIGRFAGGIAHDFNNLLAIIMGYTEYLQLRPKTNSFPEDHEMAINEIINSCKKARDLTKQLLLMSSNKKVQNEDINVYSTTFDMIKLLKRIVPAGINLKFVHSMTDIYVKVSKSQFEQIILNLVINSIDAIAEGPNKQNGEICIEIRIIEINDPNLLENTVIPVGEYLQFSIIDNGIGMDHKTKQRIFEPFFTTKIQGKGTGLGLSTVYGIVNNNRGYINIISEIGNGTEFQIFFPCEYKAEIKKSQKNSTENKKLLVNKSEPQLKQVNNIRIMVVEDNQSLRLLIVKLVDSLGYNFIAFENGLDAKKYLEETDNGKIDLVISDILMPYIGGKELYEWILMNYSSQIPFIFVSNRIDSNFDPETRRTMSNVDFIEKPFKLEILEAKITELLNPQLNRSVER